MAQGGGGFHASVPFEQVCGSVVRAGHVCAPEVCVGSV